MRQFLRLLMAVMFIGINSTAGYASPLTIDRATFGERVQAPANSTVPPAPAMGYQGPPPLPPIDTAPIPGRPGSPGPGLPGSPGSGTQQDELLIRMFYDANKIDGKALGSQVRDEYPALSVETLRFIELAKDGGSAVYKKDGALFFGKGRYDVLQTELPAVLIKKNDQHLYGGANQDLSMPNIEKLIKDSLQLDPVKPESNK